MEEPEERQMRMSCDSCSRLKRRCGGMGGAPCEYCTQKGKQCVYSEKKRSSRVYPPRADRERKVTSGAAFSGGGTTDATTADSHNATQPFPNMLDNNSSGGRGSFSESSARGSRDGSGSGASTSVSTVAISSMSSVPRSDYAVGETRSVNPQHPYHDFDPRHESKGKPGGARFSSGGSDVISSVSSKPSGYAASEARRSVNSHTSYHEFDTRHESRGRPGGASFSSNGGSVPINSVSNLARDISPVSEARTVTPHLPYHAVRRNSTGNSSVVDADIIIRSGSVPLNVHPVDERRFVRQHTSYHEFETQRESQGNLSRPSSGVATAIDRNSDVPSHVSTASDMRPGAPHVPPYNTFEEHPGSSVEYPSRPSSGVAASNNVSSSAARNGSTASERRPGSSSHLPPYLALEMHQKSSIDIPTRPSSVPTQAASSTRTAPKELPREHPKSSSTGGDTRSSSASLQPPQRALEARQASDVCTTGVPSASGVRIGSVLSSVLTDSSTGQAPFAEDTYLVAFLKDFVPFFPIIGEVFLCGAMAVNVTSLPISDVHSNHAHSSAIQCSRTNNSSSGISTVCIDSQKPWEQTTAPYDTSIEEDSAWMLPCFWSAVAIGGIIHGLSNQAVQRYIDMADSLTRPEILCDDLVETIMGEELSSKGLTIVQTLLVRACVAALVEDRDTYNRNVTRAVEVWKALGGTGCGRVSEAFNTLNSSFIPGLEGLDIALSQLHRLTWVFNHDATQWPKEEIEKCDPCCCMPGLTFLQSLADPLYHMNINLFLLRLEGAFTLGVYRCACKDIRGLQEFQLNLGSIHSLLVAIQVNIFSHAPHLSSLLKISVLCWLGIVKQMLANHAGATAIFIKIVEVVKSCPAATRFSCLAHRVEVVAMALHSLGRTAEYEVLRQHLGMGASVCSSSLPPAEIFKLPEFACTHAVCKALLVRMGLIKDKRLLLECGMNSYSRFERKYM